ncbi:LCP family protein [Kitasatospora sp. GP82]|uniref:LCP family protein n=1 Tax=Kitasatospora sp. GP82 TaxID=3035089 RepID=UPI002474D7BD|nr:LCP family protein [Kitasatospora sp. GP82]MDH6124086.1 LCP family protein required for cell wall assembly [Kitasatospora sp. GP82]
MAEDDHRDDSGKRPLTSKGGGRRRFLLITAGSLAFLLLAGGTLAWLAYRRLDGNIGTDTVTGRRLQNDESSRPSRDAGAGQSLNILLIGSDSRAGANAAYGSDGSYDGGQRSDTTILLHLSGDRRHATAVSIPRDVMVTVPPCELSDGTRTATRFIQFNWAFELGGPACTIRAVEKFSGIRIDHHLILDFTGFKKMVDAVDGVDVCVPKPIHDRDANLDLPAGRQTLHGEQALGYVRARETLGNGSDTDRMGRQQQFLASLMRKVQSQGVLLNPVKLWPLLDAATSSITADAELSRLSALYDLTQDLREIPPEDLAFLTTPRRPYPGNGDRDQFVQPQADQLFAALRADRPVEVQPYAPTPTATASHGANPDPSLSPSAGSRGAGSAGGAEAAVSSAPAAGSTAFALPGTPGTPSASGSTVPETGPTLEGSTADRDACAMH